MANIEKIEAFNITKKKKLRVAAYARVSTTNDGQIQSLVNQKQHYKQEIESSPDYEFAGLYFDEGISGTKIKKREGLIKLLEDCEKGKIDRVVTKSISRFSRNLTDCLEMVRKLKELNISILFEKENIDTGHMDSELMLTILGSIAESESKSISENVKWSVKHRYEQNEYIVATAPFGYKKVDKNICIDEYEGPYAKQMFELAANGYGSHQIARIMNEQGVKPRYAKTWSSSSILMVLTNEKYTGDCMFQKFYSDDNYVRRKNKGLKAKYLVKDHHEALISKELFDIVNKEIERRKKEKPRGLNKSHTFTGKIICGECGSKCHAGENSSSKSKDATWTCYSHRNHLNNCSMLPEKEKDIQFAFVKMLNKLKLFKKDILVPYFNLIKKPDYELILNKTISEIDKAISETNKKEDELFSLYTNKNIDDNFFKSEHKNIINELMTLNDKKEKILSDIDNRKVQISECRKIIKYLDGIEEIDKYNDETFLKFIDLVKLREKKTYEFDLKCGLKLIERVK